MVFHRALAAGLLAACLAAVTRPEFVCFSTDPDGDGTETRRRLQSSKTRPASYEILGHLSLKSAPIHLPSIHTCFGGVGLSKCIHVPKTWKEDAPDSVNTPFHFNASFEYGKPYCLECCPNHRTAYEFSSTWRMYCDLRGGEKTIFPHGVDIHRLNVNEYEFRFARQRSLLDDCVTTCSLTKVSSTSVVAGYQLTIDVREYGEGFSYWRGVESCTASLVEKKRFKETDKVKQFWEAITIENSPAGKAHISYALLAAVISVHMIVFSYCTTL